MEEFGSSEGRCFGDLRRAAELCYWLFIRILGSRMTEAEGGMLTSPHLSAPPAKDLFAAMQSLNFFCQLPQVSILPLAVSR
jgi:hypothetical protein